MGRVRIRCRIGSRMFRAALAARHREQRQQRDDGSRETGGSEKGHRFVDRVAI
jgi:hypothetical protein